MSLVKAGDRIDSAPGFRYVISVGPVLDFAGNPGVDLATWGIGPDAATAKAESIRGFRSLWLRKPSKTFLDALRYHEIVDLTFARDGLTFRQASKVLP